MRTLTRLSRLGDGALAEASRTCRAIFLNMQPDFVALDAQFGGAFADDWLAEIEAVEGTQTDENTLDMLQHYTQLMMEQSEVVKKHTESLAYFVQLACAGFPYRKKEFGFDTIARHRRGSFADMVAACKVTHRIVVRNQAMLLAVGMPPTMPDTYITEVQKLYDAMCDQEEYKLMRIELTRQRTERANLLHQRQRLVYKAAQVIYFNEPIKINLFAMQ